MGVGNIEFEGGEEEEKASIELAERPPDVQGVELPEVAEINTAVAETEQGASAAETAVDTMEKWADLVDMPKEGAIVAETKQATTQLEVLKEEAAEITAETPTKAPLEKPAEPVAEAKEENNEINEAQKHIEEISAEFAAAAQKFDTLMPLEKLSPEQAREMVEVLTQMSEKRTETVAAGAQYMEKMIKEDKKTADEHGAKLYAGQRAMFEKIQRSQKEMVKKFARQEGMKEQDMEKGVNKFVKSELGKEELSNLIRFDELRVEARGGEDKKERVVDTLIKRFDTPYNGGDTLGELIGESGIEVLTTVLEKAKKDADNKKISTVAVAKLQKMVDLTKRTFARRNRSSAN